MFGLALISVIQTITVFDELNASRDAKVVGDYTGLTPP
jgi:hypothetical protein